MRAPQVPGGAVRGNAATTVEFQPGVAPALHVCLPADDELWAGQRTVAFMARGLDRGERVIHVGPPAGREAIVEALRALRPGVGEDIRRGQLDLVGVEELYLRDGAFDADRVMADFLRARDRAREDGYTGLRVVGTTGWVTDWNGWWRYEQRVNAVLSAEQVAALCVFDGGSLPPEAARRLRRAHPVVEYGPGGGHVADGVTWLRLVGELDFVNARNLALFLADQPRGGDVCVDLSDLEFVDVAGMRTLVSSAEELSDGRRLELHRPRPLALRMLDTLGWRGLDYMRVVTDECEEDPL